MRTQIRGRILIHASSTVKRQEREAEAVAGYRLDELDTGKLVGSVEIVGCVPFKEEMAEEMRPSGSYGGEWQPAQFSWVLRNPARLRTPVEFKGKLGFFDVPDSMIPRAITRDLWPGVPGGGLERARRRRAGDCLSGHGHAPG